MWVELLWVLPFSPGGFSPGTPVFPSTQKPTLPNSKSIWKARTRFNEFVRTPKCAPWVSKLQKKKNSQKKVIIIRERQSTLEIFKRSFTRTGANVWNLIPFDRRNRLLNAFFREKFEDFYSILFWIRATMLKSTIKLFQRKHALRALQNRCEVLIISTGNSMICSGIWHKYLEWYFNIVIRNFTSR